ncbi:MULTISPECIES: 2OG-Fe(II) oxygenase [unclassified Janthinobacterium]|uniref:2OG-Fe(II) oxygenase n=1 Tax=unclassified Janthinobacterium TaxID=2610881 RepID=UPI0004755F56|nr:MULTISPECIES: 2OG-Fe(II) oxygenase [unclassified Janthinobacterium]MEC5160055.1 putative 2-oxoglutarate/Fe(II)-dependent dioxygenase YbiX [Janthinobacterium sp. CG_S6]
MPNISTDLPNILSSVRCDGDFYSAGTSEIAPPNLSVDGVGLISLPFQQAQLEQLIAVANRAPFGLGAQTLVDTSVRKTWQIDASQLHFGGRHWQRSLDAIVAQASAGLGVTEPVVAQLYKLLVYDTGSFFVPHRDTEKADGMFATLVVVLPSVYTGGELSIRHRERAVNLELARADPSDAAFVAFYADCLHEVRPVNSGTRLTLIYNLVRSGPAGAAAPPQYLSEQAQATSLLKRWLAQREANDEDAPEKLVYPLEHAYSAAELGFSTLKSADAAVAKVLLAAAAASACDIHVAQLVIEESGSAEYDGGDDYYSRRRGRYRDDDDPDNYSVAEIIERSASVSGWRDVDGNAPSFGDLPLQDMELCPPDVLDEADPDEQHFREATGNEGASFERSYRRAALVLWPRARRLAVLAQGGLAGTLPYLDKLVLAGHADGADAAALDDAKSLAGMIVRDWPSRVSHRGDAAARCLASLARLGETALIDRFLAEIPASGRYDGGENASLAAAALLLPPARAAELIDQIVGANANYALGACADLLAKSCAERPDAPSLLAPAARTLVDALLGVHVGAPAAQSWRSAACADAALVVNMLGALRRMEAGELAGAAIEHMLAHYDADAVLVAAALALGEECDQFAPARRLRAWARAHLRARIALDLSAPQDFRRPSALACDCEYCRRLAAFLADPASASWTLKAAEAQRRHVERSIAESRCDVNCATVRQGSPHGLACTKNQASYTRRVAQRAQDLAHLARLTP